MADDSFKPEPNSPPQPAPSQAQPVRIHFPDRFIATRTHGDSSRSSSINTTPPAQAMLHSRSENRAVMDTSEVRQRVHSLGPDPVPSGSKMSKNASLRHYSSRRKKNLTQSQSPPLPSHKVDSLMSNFEPNAFSDEYDLYPKILQDVQRALHLQSRRRERMSQQLYLTSDEVPLPTDAPINTSTPYPSTSTAPHTSPQYLQGVSLPSEVDFSPSTRSVPLHPVPVSSDGGATLDWTGSQSEDEKLDRRWSISRGKRKAKEKILPASKAVVEKQEALFTDRISRIRNEASPPTMRKASIVSEQLGRRYNILYASITAGDPVGLLQIARWHAGLSTETQAWLDSAEPLTWLKHLLDRRGKQRSQWHMSALIVEECIKARKSATLSDPQPQSPTASTSLETPPSQRGLKAPMRQISTSDSSPGTSLKRIRSSEGRVSFSPLIESPHDSLNTSQTRAEGKARGWRYSFPAPFDSGSANDTSPYHQRNSSGRLSPASSRLHIIHRFRRHPVESDEGSSSPFGSQSEDQNDSSQSGLRRKSQRKPHPSGLHLPQETVTEIDTSNGMDVISHFPVDPISTSVFSSRPDLDPAEFPEGHALTCTIPRPPDNRLHRSASLPFTSEPSPNQPGAKTILDEEGHLEAEYDLRSRTLEELKSHNHRLRHRMQRVAVDVREYEMLCAGVMPALGIAYHSLPMELLDAFSHDPCAVTSGTRKRHGWRVVEDIHTRVLRQREILAGFLSEAKTDVAICIPGNILDKPINSLMDKLQALETEREPLRQQADEVSRMLMAVRTSHSTVKEEFNDTLSHTSVIYPELSHIVALEESYKDQYQQIWELGMDALTLILDTIAPFWRSYGKMIGEDMQDFIIIPWYRNEFTGEPKRYPVQSVPRRSLRHWVALFCLCALTFFIAFLQGRAAITSAWHYRLLWINNQAFRWTIMPFFWVMILIQWFAFTFEICVLMLYIAVVAWWLGWCIGICT